MRPSGILSVPVSGAECAYGAAACFNAGIAGFFLPLRGPTPDPFAIADDLQCRPSILAVFETALYRRACRSHDRGPGSPAWAVPRSCVGLEE